MDLLKSRTGRILIESHRGAEGLAPENSWQALKAGSDAMADFIEVDVQLSQDKIAFLWHNYTLPDNRWCSQVPWAEIKNIKVVDAAIPCLEDVLVWARENNVCLSLDLKTGFMPEGMLTEEVLRVLDRTNTQDRVMLICWDHLELLRIKKAHPKMATRALLRGRLTQYGSFLEFTRPDAVSLSYGLIRPGDVEEIHRAGVAILMAEMWCPDFEAVQALNVDMVSWSDPYEAKKLLDQV